MHLLVLSAFRLVRASHPNVIERGLNAPFGAQCFPTFRDYRGKGYDLRLNAPFGAQCFPTYELDALRESISGSQCTFWCSVLSDRSSGTETGGRRHGLNAPFGAQCFPTLYSGFGFVPGLMGLNAPFGAQCFPTRSNKGTSAARSQCTFWCSVLSDQSKPCRTSHEYSGLNAPFGAQCFPTRWSLAAIRRRPSTSQCTFWCSVLSDPEDVAGAFEDAFVSMHLLVLSAFRRAENEKLAEKVVGLNAPFGAQCFPTKGRLSPACGMCSVSMHLLVLSAFRRPGLALWLSGSLSLNAPFGAQCFPTANPHGPEHPPTRGLNAPFGAQCFPTVSSWLGLLLVGRVSMHLLVLSAFRQKRPCRSPFPARVSMHLLVLSAFRPKEQGCRQALVRWVSMHLLVLSAFRHDRAFWRSQPRVSMHLLVLSAFRLE